MSVINVELGSPDEDMKQERCSTDEAIKLGRLEKAIEHLMCLCEKQKNKELWQLVSKNKWLFSRVSNKLERITKEGSKK